MKAFKIRDFWLIAGLNEGLKGIYHHRMGSSAEVNLLAKPISLYLFFKCRLQNPWARAANCLCHSKDSIPCFAGMVFVNCNERWSAKSFLIELTNALTWSLWCDHYYIDIFWRDYPLPVDCCSVRKAKCLPLCNMLG